MTSTLTALTAEAASGFARLALGHVAREYPNKLDHVMNGPGDVRGPRELHPVFYGSFDWHSCVHGYWLLARLLRRFPGMEEADAIRALFDEHLTEEKVAAEVAYLGEPLRATFERPYGWAWLLMLAAELGRHGTAEGRRWTEALRPLAEAFAARFHGFLPKATYPVRAGTHFNTAFALALGLEYADAAGDGGLHGALAGKAREWYGGDRGCQAWEPGGDDFLSPALVEAECMRHALGEEEFREWLGHFLPGIAQGEPATLFTPPAVSDRTDGKIAHLDGLSLSRAWCWRSLASALPPGDARRDAALRAAEAHLEAGLRHVAGDYMGEHWLATFAVLALEAPGDGDPGVTGRSGARDRPPR